MDVHRTPARSSSNNAGAESRLLVAVSARTLWLIAGIALLFIGVGVVLLKGILVFLLLFTGIVLAEGIRPLVDRLQRWRVPRPLAVLLVYLGLVAIVALLMWVLLQPVIAQIAQLTARLPSYMSRIGSFLTSMQSRLNSSSQLSGVLSAARSSASGFATSILSYALGLPQMLGSLLLSIVLVAVIAFFWLTGVQGLKPLMLSLFPEEARPSVSDLLSDMGYRLSGYVRGVGINMLVVGALSGAVDWLLGIPYALLLGIVAGMTEIIPYFGPWISGGVAAIVALIAVSPIAALEVVAAYILIQEVEGHVLIPFVMMRSVKLNPLTVVIAVLLGTELLGIIGGILAVPAAAVVEVVFMRAIVPVVRARVAHHPSRIQLADGARDGASDD
jgi:predicted PurR-regulated permease PerM